MKAERLRTEYLDRPLGLGEVHPRFSWQCKDGLVQTAYRIQAMREGQLIWDSGKVKSARMTHIPYEGAPLTSRDRVQWSVQLWDESDMAGEQVTSWFEMGLLHPEDWTAKWIAGDYQPIPGQRYPVDYFQKAFTLRKKVSQARLYATALGLYEARINGERVGDFQLAPGCTDYRKRLQYQVYDVTDMLGKHNRLEIQLADGWYRGSIGCFGKTEAYGNQTKLLCQMEIRYVDGECHTVNSDSSFRWSNDGPLRFADLKDGEVYDATLTPSYKGNALLADGGMYPVASNNVQPVIRESFRPTLLQTPSGKRVLDFGQNLAGFIAFRIQGPRGARLRLLMGEILDASGEMTQKNIQVQTLAGSYGQSEEMLIMSGQYDNLEGELRPTPLQEVQFTLSGGQDSYQTTFSVFGFQYAQVETDLPISAEDFEAFAVYSDMAQTGFFSSSDQRINRLFENILWSMKGNFLDLPTDCPTRERMGWTGDGQIFFDSAHYLMDAAPLYRKWLYDFMDAQAPNGVLPAVIPFAGFPMMYNNIGGSVGWADAAVLVPYRFWKLTGDERMLRTCYDMMKRYADWMMAQTGQVDEMQTKDNPYNQYVYEKGAHLGEWLEPEQYRDDIATITTVPKTEECTAYLHLTMRLMAEVARHVGQVEDAALYQQYAEGAIKAYHHLFVKDSGIDTDRQAKLVRPIALGLLSGQEKANAERRLLKAVRHASYCVGTGFLSTVFLLPVLCDAGFVEDAYRMIENEKAPGWLAQLKSGATTIWENWDGEASRNHYSPGAVCQWLFAYVGGIRVQEERRFVIAPTPGGSLTHAAAVYDSLYGRVSSRWERHGSSFQLMIQVPPNTSAQVLLPDGSEHSVAAGKHVFTFQTRSMEDDDAT